MNLYSVVLPSIFMGASVFFIVTATAQSDRATIETRQLIMDVAKTIALLAIAVAIILK